MIPSSQLRFFQVKRAFWRPVWSNIKWNVSTVFHHDIFSATTLCFCPAVFFLAPTLNHLHAVWGCTFIMWERNSWAKAEEKERQRTWSHVLWLHFIEQCPQCPSYLWLKMMAAPTIYIQTFSNLVMQLICGQILVNSLKTGRWKHNGALKTCFNGQIEICMNILSSYCELTW